MEAYGIASDAIDFGKRFFKRVNEQAFSLVCGPDATDVREREQLMQAFGLGSEAVTGVLATLFIAQSVLARWGSRVGEAGCGWFLGDGKGLRFQGERLHTLKTRYRSEYGSGIRQHSMIPR